MDDSRVRSSVEPLKNSQRDLVDAVKTRVESLSHTRTLIGVGGSILTGLSVGAAAAGQALSVASEGSEGLRLQVQCIPWGLDPFVVVFVVLTDLFFLLSLFTLTDAIHNYSKVLEYMVPGLFPGGCRKSGLAHRRALAADDLSYFFVRWGIVFLVATLLLCVPVTLLASPLAQSKTLHFVAAGLCLLAALSVVFVCYDASHCEVGNGVIESPTSCEALKRFFDPGRWTCAAASPVGFPSTDAAAEPTATSTSTTPPAPVEPSAARPKQTR